MLLDLQNLEHILRFHPFKVYTNSVSTKSFLTQKTSSHTVFRRVQKLEIYTDISQKEIVCKKSEIEEMTKPLKYTSFT